MLSGSVHFGKALATGNFNCRYADLAVGFPFEKIGSASSSTAGGSVFVAHGGAGGLLQPFDGFRISQNESDIPDTAEFNDEFGAALAAGGWNGDGCDDLAIGMTSLNTVGTDGGEIVLHGYPFRSSFEGSAHGEGLDSWTTVMP